jgi:hypothetical protein
MLPNWFLFLGAIGIVIWILVGVLAAKAFIVMRERAGKTFLPPPRPKASPDDADWWKNND